MSGAELLLVIGAASGTITIIDSIIGICRQACRTSNDPKVLPRTFRDAVRRLPLMRETLQAVSERLYQYCSPSGDSSALIANNDAVEGMSQPEVSASAVESALHNCMEKLTLLESLCKKYVLSLDASLACRCIAVSKAHWRGTQVAGLMKGLLEDVQLLAQLAAVQGPRERQMRDAQETVRLHALVETQSRLSNGGRQHVDSRKGSTHFGSSNNNMPTISSNESINDCLIAASINGTPRVHQGNLASDIGHSNPNSSFRQEEENRTQTDRRLDTRGRGEENEPLPEALASGDKNENDIGHQLENLASSNSTSDRIEQQTHTTTESAICQEPFEAILDKTSYEQIEQLDSQMHIGFLRMLNDCPYAQRKDQNVMPLEGTCEWLINHPRFKRWEETKQQLLLVTGIAGAGKSVLAKYLIDELHLKSPQKNLIYFFFKQGFNDQQRALHAVRALLHQLFKQDPSLLDDDLLEKVDHDGHNFFQSFIDLWNTFTDITKRVDQVTCVLDGLDECQQGDLPQLVRNIIALTSDGHHPGLKFLMTSRPCAQIQDEFQELKIQIPCEIASEEVDNLIHLRIHGICEQQDLNSRDGKLLYAGMKKVPNKTFQWAVLVLDLVQKSLNTRADVPQVIEQIPQTLDAAYECILNRSSNHELSRKILRLVLVAKRPLSLAEVSTALEITGSSLSFDHDAIRDYCGLLLAVTDQKLYLSHPSARDFLLRPEQSQLATEMGSLRWKHSIDLESAHRLLAEICVQHMSQPDLDGHRDCFTYSNYYWADHFREAKIESFEESFLLAAKACEYIFEEFQFPQLAFRTKLSRDASSTPGLSIASFLGLNSLVDHFLRKGAEINCPNTQGMTALSWAAWGGHATTTQMLLDCGAEIDVKDEEQLTALFFGIDGNNVEAVRVLLNNGAGVNHGDRAQQTPLHWAIEKTDVIMTEMLLQFGAEINARSLNWRTPLWSATLLRNLEGVKTLIRHGAAVDAADAEYGWTPLHLAVCVNNKDMAQLFLADHSVLESPS